MYMYETKHLHGGVFAVEKEKSDLHHNSERRTKASLLWKNYYKGFLSIQAP